jgi:hypothetical protein
MSLTKHFLAGNNLIIPGQGQFGKWHLGWGRENSQPFLQFYRRGAMELVPKNQEHRIFSLGIFYLWTFMAVLKLWQFSGSTPMTRTSGRMVFMARAVPVKRKHTVNLTILLMEFL